MNAPQLFLLASASEATLRGAGTRKNSLVFSGVLVNGTLRHGFANDSIFSRSPAH